MSYERSISVIGLGRVGLPLALSFADRGVRVLGVDHDRAVLDSIRAGRMPWSEAGTQELLDRVAATGRLELAERAADAAVADDIVITIGTPRSSTSRATCDRSVPPSTTCCRCCARGTR